MEKKIRHPVYNQIRRRPRIVFTVSIHGFSPEFPLNIWTWLEPFFILDYVAGL